MLYRVAVCALILGSFFAASRSSYADLSVTVKAPSSYAGDINDGTGVYDSSDSGPVVNLSLTSAGSIGSQNSSGGSVASTGPFNLAYGTTSISGSGSSTATVVPAGSSADGEAKIHLNFTVNKLTNFTLSSTLGAGGGRLALSSIYIGDTNIISSDYGQIVEEQLNSGSNTFHDAGRFLPGDTYVLSVVAWSEADNGFTNDNNANGSFQFDMEIPEPAAGTILSLSSLLLLARRRRCLDRAQPISKLASGA